MRYLERMHPEDRFSFLDAWPMLRKLEKDFSPSRDMLEKADAIVFSYPVYTFIAPYPLHRFIDLARDSGCRISGKWATQFTTSKHFYDVTAHGFMRENMLDLGLKVLPGLSADMEDLLSEDGRRKLMDWAGMCRFRIKMGIAETREPGGPGIVRDYSPRLPLVQKRLPGKVSIVTNADCSDAPLLAMIEDFRRSLPIDSVVYDIGKYSFSGWCTGCFSCARTGRCVHRDGFDSLLRDGIQDADGIVYAFRIKNHFTASSMKLYDDRQFCNGHRAVTAGRPAAYIIAGDLSREDNLRMVLEARASVGGNYLAAIASDEADAAKSVSDAASLLSYAIEHRIRASEDFYGVGGNKIFRDLVYEMRGLMKADHLFYKRHGLYDDFPQRHAGRILFMKLAGLMLSLPGAGRKGLMAKGMLAPYEKAVAEASPDKGQ